MKEMIDMVKQIRLTTAEDLRQFMNLAWKSEDDVGVHAPDGQIADAKSILWLIALDYSQPVLVVTENQDFLRKIAQWIVE